ncbi:MAG: folylpolyglutamate synthase/dihydrofolate synthase family protein [Thermodesulfobacteriota bacterium]
MNYNQAVEYMFSLQKFGIKLGLNSTENLLEALGRPHDHLKILHLAGTNGKGSVGAMVCAILGRAGYKVGFYTSPHLVSFRERFALGGEMISEEDVTRLAGMVLSVCRPEEPPTFFEFVTAMAFQYFYERRVDLAVMETGLGGRLDATNVARPLVGVITNIALEHTEHLGPTLVSIAREKAGIIKPGMLVVTGERRPRLRALFDETARDRSAELAVLGRDFQVRSNRAGGFDYRGLSLRLKNLRTNLAGRHQVVNAALALAALEGLGRKGFNAGEADIRAGLTSVRWPARAELRPGGPGRPDLMLDGAHNPAAAKVLARLLRDMKYHRLHLVLGIMADKDVTGIMAPLLPLAQVLYLTRPVYFRAAEPEALAALAQGFPGPVSVHRTVPQALEAASAAAGPGDLVLVTGSLFTVGEALKHLASCG